MLQSYSKYVRGATYIGVALVWAVIGWGNASLIISIFMVSYTAIILVPWLTGFLYGTITLVALYLTLVRYQERDVKACVALGIFAALMLATNFYFLWITLAASILASQNTILLTTIHALPMSVYTLSCIFAILPFTTAYFLLYALVKEQYMLPVRTVQAVKPVQQPTQRPQIQQQQSKKVIQQPSQKQQMYIPDFDEDDLRGFK